MLAKEKKNWIENIILNFSMYVQYNVKLNAVKLTGDIVVEFERRHVPVNGHISPRLAEFNHLSTPSTHLPILLCPYETPRQLPVPNLEQVSWVISNPHYVKREIRDKI